MSNKKIGLVLEGGASKGIFTAGVLDYWLYKKVEFPYIVSVSAGTCNALDYVSKQPKRTKNCMIMVKKEDKYFGFNNFFKSGKIFDLDKLFFEYSYKQFPFDAETYMKSPVVNEIVVTNCKTGKADYLSEKEDEDKLMLIGKASCSIPLLAEIVDIDGEKYLDGGISDSIPVKRAFEQGCDKVVVVMTHNVDYVPTVSPQMKIVYDKIYRDYPEFVKALYSRPKMYTKELKYISKGVEEGKILVVRPKLQAVKRLETDKDKLKRFYEHGYETGRNVYNELMKFMENV